MSETSMDEIRKSLKKELDKSRYEHTMGVMYTAAALAMAHGADQKKSDACRTSSRLRKMYSK